MFAKSILVCAFCIKLPIYISVVRLILLLASFIYSFAALLFERVEAHTFQVCLCVCVSIYTFFTILSNQPSNFIIGFSFSVFSLVFAHNIYCCCRSASGWKQPLYTIWSIIRTKDTIHSTLQYIII